MSLKAELETWAAALKAYDDQDFEKSLQLFQQIAESSKILTNIGLIYATLGEHDLAVSNYNAATSLDQYLAVAYFQCGVSNFLLGQYELALKDFEEAFLYLRGNQAINYEQLGLNFKLYSAEVLFNKGLCHIYIGEEFVGIQTMQDALKDKAIAEHNVIDEAIRDRGEGYTVFSIPVGVLYRPSESKLKNAKTKDYLGKAKLVATADANDAYTTFSGVTRLKQGLTPSGARLETGRNAGSPVGVTSPRRSLLGNSPSKASDLTSAPPPLQKSVSMADIRSRFNNTRPNDGNSSVRTFPPSSAPRGLPPRRGTEESIRPLRPSVQTDFTSISARPSPPAASPSATNGPSTARPWPNQNQTRLTEIYNDYIDEYSGDEPPLPPNAKQRVVNEAKELPSVPRLTRYPSSSRTSPESVAGSSSGTIRRKLTRKLGYGPRSQFSQNDEGYDDTDYGDGPFELVKIRVKLHYKDEVRGMATAPDMTFEDFLEKVTSKFGKSFGSLYLQFKDEDGGKVSLRDESDYELAIETAKESANGKPEGKLEIWCADA